ncbi:hypothetical protein KVR01_005993 [Diaporthe batatas]|uniref:uncharacterized protein n=1 Tax=Diaporthe batatas TaxID=748121 RepID=UPI001D052DDA|nr:uncharacterized protein KVR01_005993 [Diaporthe batatas]KAG8164075.1 hypothetical protein KVR01_005993 [Diaporthe batatas]
MSRQRQTNTQPARSIVPSAGEPISYDVLVVGAGIAGINTAYRLKTQMPHLSFTVLEARDEIGGTWDLFRYPGVRSDSDMYTFGFAWHPWRRRVLGDGDEIMAYLHESVSKYGLEEYLKLGHKVVKADWTSAAQRWTVQVDHKGQPKTYAAKWLVLGPGLFEYDKPFPAVIPGIDKFKGKVFHPQHWPAGFDYTDKKVVIIGSGATAITMLPAMVAGGAKNVTMLQRSPSHIAAMPNPDNRPSGPGRLLPFTTLIWLRRMTWFGLMWMIHFMCAKFPGTMRRSIADNTRKQLPAHIPLDPHFVPSYNPWDQRLCLDKDGEFFAALRSGKADVVTATIKTVTAGGIELDGGSTLDADIIVTATGWILRFGGGIPISVDNKPTRWQEKLLWNKAMVQDVPNMFFMWGYTNAAWTLGVDSTATIMCRVLKHMEREGTRVVVPKTRPGSEHKTQTIWKLSSTYRLASEPYLPKYGSDGPWKPRRHFIYDTIHARWGNVTEGLEFLS